MIVTDKYILLLLLLLLRASGHLAYLAALSLGVVVVVEVRFFSPIPTVAVLVGFPESDLASVFCTVPFSPPPPALLFRSYIVSSSSSSYQHPAQHSEEDDPDAEEDPDVEEELESFHNLPAFNLKRGPNVKRLFHAEVDLVDGVRLDIDAWS